MWRLLIFISIFLISCSEEESSADTTGPSGEPSTGDIPSKLYVCDQGSDRVIVLDPSNELNQIGDPIDIDFSDDENDAEIPHFIIIDELNGYWFVTTFQSGFVGMFDLDTDTLISTINVGDSPALLAVDEENSKLYVSRMMDMGMGMGMDMNDGDKLNALDYSSGILEAIDPVCLSNDEILEFPEPHAISFSNNTSRNGGVLLTASFTADWFSRTDIFSSGLYQTIHEPFNEGETAPIEVNELFPLAVVQKDNFAFFSCSGSSAAGVKGQVQSWVVGEQSYPVSKSIYEFETSSKLWHIVESPLSSHIFVVLSGDSETPGSAGVACLSYDSEGVLGPVWETTDSSFDTLHGITASSDGSLLYVSSRGNGSVYVFDANTGDLLSTVSGVGMMMDGMMMMGSLSGIAVTQTQ